MLVSALLTSVGINVAICATYITLYSVLKKLPINLPVYAPRLIQEHQNTTPPSRYRNLLQLLPSVSWVKFAWQASENDIFAVAGADGIVLIRIFIFSIKVFAAGLIIGVFVLLPVNYFGNQLQADFSDLTNKSLNAFSISNVSDGSKWLWIHFSAAYVFTGVVCYFLYYEYMYIAYKRIAWFNASKPLPSQFTILVRSISPYGGRNYGEIVERFFLEYYHSTYHSKSMVYKSSRIHYLLDQAKKLIKQIGQLRSKTQLQGKTERRKCFGFIQPNIEDFEMKLRNMGKEVREEQYQLRNKEIPASFVTFKSRYAASVALRMRQVVDPTKWVTEEAPEPGDVQWRFFSSSFIGRWTRQLVALSSYAIFTLLFLVPVVFVQGLANLNQLQKLFPFLGGILKLKVVSQLVTGYLPSLILDASLFLAESVVMILSKFQGFISVNQTERSACFKLLLFTIWNVFFANALSGSALSDIGVFLEPKKIPTVLASSFSSQAAFFISIVVTSGWTSLAAELFQLIPLLLSYIQRIIPGEDEFRAPSTPYVVEIPRILLFGLVGVTFFFLAPLILPFVFIYFCAGYIIYKNQLLNVYEPIYETNGKYWFLVHNTTIFSLVFMHIIAIGIFSLKKLALAGSLIGPLPILTLIFNDYCRRRFRPMFDGYPIECLVRKDKEDESDPGMALFFDELANAYEDPAFMPFPNGERESLVAPLL